MSCSSFAVHADVLRMAKSREQREAIKWLLVSDTPRRRQDATTPRRSTTPRHSTTHTKRDKLMGSDC